VTHFRVRIQAVALLTAAVMMAGSLGAAPSVRHEACASAQHHCGRTAPILRCCCSHETEATQLSGVIQSRTGVFADASVSWLPPQRSGSAAPVSSRTDSHPAGRDVPIDLVTALSTLRI